MSSSPLLAARPRREITDVRSESSDPGSGVLGSRWLSRQQAAVFACVLAVAGVFAIFSTANFLWDLWTTDPLKSIGGFIPIVSLVLILRVWRSLDWEMRGTWWGLALVAVTIASVHLRDHAILELILTPSWTIFMPPHSLVAFAYTAGIVLLFGGVPLLRAALFPVVLMWFVNPVPNAFNRFIDLPLQHASALIARGFAHALGQKLSPDQLKLMFTPDFGMFIAPGCNGIRGAITMGFIALVAGYLYRFRKLHWVLTVSGAVALGYIFNFVRLCTLVLYYIVALRITWLQTRAEMGDYLIGACLFFFATALLFFLIRRFSVTGDLRLPALPPRKEAASAPAPGSSVQRASAEPSFVQPASAEPSSVRLGFAPRSFTRRWAALALLLVIGSVSYARALLHDHEVPHALSDPTALGRFPKQVGNYALQREWNEYLPTGPLIFYWADYQVPGGALVSVGISPVLGAHDTLICHSARGDDWLWHGDLRFATAAQLTSFSTSLFSDGATQYLEATTVCTGETCGQYSTTRRRLGFVYSRPDTHTLLTQSPSRPIPVLLRTETLDQGLNADAARALLTQNLREFLASAKLADFTSPYRAP